MSVAVKAMPQVKVTCKRTSKKLNIEALDKNTINEIKKVTDIYILNIESVAVYDGEVDEDGYAVDGNAYSTWKQNHLNIISKTSINNILRCAKNNSRMNFEIGWIYGTCYPICNGNEFRINGWNITGDLRISIFKFILSNISGMLFFDESVYFDVIRKDIE